MAEMESFARKYRPTKMSEYVGNEGVKDTLRRYLAHKKPQSILLTGNTGCGKTTLARLIAKEYLCTNRDDVTGACGHCSNCEAVDEYIRTGSTEMLTDLYEIDITASSGKKDIDYLLETVEYPPLNGWKIYAFDEVHMASVSAQNRMLKVLEEPPENVLMIFCTTNPEKMLDTLKNRCQLSLNITKPDLKSMLSYLRRICLSENKEFDNEGLRLIATTSDFVLRDAANSLERVLNTRGNAKAESVAAEFREVSDKIIFDFYQAYKEKDFLRYISILYKIKTEYDFNQFLVSLTNFTVRGVYVVNGIDLEGLSDIELNSYKDLFREFSPKELSHILGALKRMGNGSVEANLMSFIYSEEDDNSDTDSVKLNLTQHKQENTTAPSEVSFRNQVLQKKEKVKIQEGLDSLSGKAKEVSFKDMGALFQLEKVRKN